MVGHSSEGRPLKVVRIGSGDRSKPAVFIDGGIHARWVVELLKITKFCISTSTYKVTYLLCGDNVHLKLRICAIGRAAVVRGGGTVS